MSERELVPSESQANYHHLFDGNYWWPQPSSEPAVGDVFMCNPPEMNGAAYEVSGHFYDSMKNSGAVDLKKVTELGDDAVFNPSQFSRFFIVRSLHEMLVATTKYPHSESRKKVDTANQLLMYDPNAEGTHIVLDDERTMFEYASFFQWRILLKGKKIPMVAYPIKKASDSTAEYATEDDMRTHAPVGNKTFYDAQSSARMRVGRFTIGKTMHHRHVNTAKIQLRSVPGIPRGSSPTVDSYHRIRSVEVFAAVKSRRSNTQPKDKAREPRRLIVPGLAGV